MAINLDHVTEQITVTDTATNASLTVQPKGTGAFNIAAGSSGVNLSNGGTVTAIALTNNGGGSGGYTGFPTITISPPTTASGVQATATVLVMQPITASVQSGGTGYTLNDVVSWVGGTPQTVAATFRVSAVSGGVVTAVTAVNYAPYLVLPTAPVSTTGGTGTGLTLTSLFYAVGGTFTITNAGSGYVEQPTVTFSGGGGSGAIAYATVGSGTAIRALGATGTQSLDFYTPASASNGVPVLRLRDTSGGDSYTMMYVSSNSASLLAQGNTNANLKLGANSAGSVVLTTFGGGQSTQFQASHTASAVNYVQATGSATGQNVVISAQGSDSDVWATIQSKNNGGVVVKATGGLYVQNASSATQFLASNTASAVNYVQATGAATGNGVTLSAAGSDTNVQVNILAKGASGVSIGSYSGKGGLYVTAPSVGVNYGQIDGANTGSSVVASSQGSDTNIGFQIRSKGTGGINLMTAGGTNQVVITNTASAVNYIQATGSATGSGVQLSAQGSDTNIPLVLQPKGTGALQAQQTDSTITGGNARGAKAVDWQLERAAANNVASSPFSVVGGGISNAVSGSGSYGGVLSGVGNTTTGFASVISGGWSNNATGGQSAVIGGYSNSATGAFNFIGGGTLNSGTANAAVTTQSATMNGTTAVTLSASNANIKVGQYIVGTSISFNTYVAAISGTSLTLSQAAGGSSTSTLSFFTPYSAVVGGGSNTATGSYSFIGGGGDAGNFANRNVASGDWSVVGGGFKNTASGLYSTVVGGYGNTANNIASFLGGGGFAFGSVLSNIVQGQSSGLVAGIFNNVTGNAAFSGAGYSNLINGQYAACMGGSFGNARSIQGNHVFPANVNPIAQVSGITQSALLVLAVQTTDATATVLRSDGGAAGTNNQVIMPNNSAYFFTGEVVAGVTGGGNTKGWTIEGVIKRGANAASTALVGTPMVTSAYADVGAATWAIAVTADTTNGGLAVTFTGQASTTIRTVAQIRTTEMTY